MNRCRKKKKQFFPFHPFHTQNISHRTSSWVYVSEKTLQKHSIFMRTIIWKLWKIVWITWDAHLYGNLFKNSEINLNSTEIYYAHYLCNQFRRLAKLLNCIAFVLTRLNSTQFDLNRHKMCSGKVKIRTHLYGGNMHCPNSACSSSFKLPEFYAFCKQKLLTQTQKRLSNIQSVSGFSMVF